MKRLLNITGGLLGLLVLGAIATALALMLGGLQRGVNLSSQTLRSPIEAFQSPIETPTPPGQGTPRATHTPPRGTPTNLPPMAAKATVAAMGAQYTPRPRPLHPIHSPQDVVNIVLNDPEFQASLNDPIFGPHTKDATPGEPLFVKSLNPDKWDYYLIPFYKANRISGVAVVGVKNGAGVMGMWANTGGDRFPPVSATEARNLAASKGFTVIGEPRLVFRWLLEGGDETSPYWEVKTAEGATFYVIHILGTTKIYRADEVHPTD